MAKCKITVSVLFVFVFSGLVTLSLINHVYAAAPILDSIILSDPDSGSTEYTNNSTINVSLNVSGSPTQMILSKYNDFNDAVWVSYANPATFVFENPWINGTRTVYCKVKNSTGEESSIAQDEIVLDTYRPSISTANSGPMNTTHVDIMFNEVIVLGADNPTNYTITNGIQVLGAQLVWVPSVYLYKYRLSTTPQTPGMQYTVTASSNLQDAAGNLIEPNGRTLTYTAVSTTDTISPQVNSFVIQNGDAYTKNQDVSILMTDSDQGGLVSKWLIMTVLSTPPPSAFTLTSRPTSYTLSAGDGVKTLYAWVMDDSGNVSMYNPSYTVDSIILDQTLPVANAGSDQSADTGVPVNFDGSLSTDNYGIVRYVWNFGDGSPAEEGANVNHSYTSEGAYMVTLTVFDAADNEASDDVIITVGEVGSPTYLEVGGPDPDYDTITEAMAYIAEGGTIYVYPGEYNENIHMKQGVILKGDNNNTTIIKGSIFFEEVNGVIDNFTILFQEGSIVSFTNTDYTNWDVVADSGITAINSAPIIKNCIIKPDLETINALYPENPPIECYGKAVQIWNMYQSPDVSPQIENNLIQDTECGIYYFSQVFGGAINGNIKNNTFYHNKDGIILRMHKEKPEIENNIITSGDTGVFLTYRDGQLFDDRNALIHHNDIWDYVYKYWLDADSMEFDLTGIAGNISVDPLFIAPTNNDFRLSDSSPCKGQADNGGDMGAQLISWPHAPTVEPIDSPTNQQFITIEGTKGANTSIVINGIECVPLDSETEWIVSSYDLGTDGDKTLIILSKNSQGWEGDSVTINLVLDTVPPEIAITSPLDNATFDTAPITVSGTINEECDVIVNNVLATVDSTTFTADAVDLHYGENTISASAYDHAGNYTTATISVTSTATSEYELIQISPDIYEDDPTEIVAGEQVELTVKLEIEGSPAQNEPIEFIVTQGSGSMIQSVINTNASGDATAILNTDNNASVTNIAEVFAQNFPSKKVAFHIDTKKGSPAILAKLTDETKTPAPGATISLIVKLTDTSDNAIENEHINFAIIQGSGTLSSNSGITDYYGIATVNLTTTSSPGTLAQITVSSVTTPSATVTFNITTSPNPTVTLEDLFNKTNLNSQKIQDQITEITTMSNDPNKPTTANYRVWQKGDLMKIEDLSTSEISIRPQLTQVGTAPANTQVIAYDQASNIYTVKTKMEGQEEERPYALTCINYDKGVITKMEFYYEADDLMTMFSAEMSDFVQIPEANSVWLYNVKTEKIYTGAENALLYTTTVTVTSRQVNVGLTDSYFQ